MRPLKFGKSLKIGIVLGTMLTAGSAWASMSDDAQGGSVDRTALPPWNPDAAATQPVQLVVSIPDQLIDVYEGGVLVASSPVSTGKKGNATPTGVFSILEKRRHHRSNIYSRAPMPFMQRLTWSGIALHASNDVPNYPASHGCVRLPKKFASKLFKFTSVGAHVIISDGTERPEGVDTASLIPAADAHAGYPVSVGAGLDVGVGGTETPRHTVAAVSDAEAKPVRVLITRRNGRERVRDVQRVLKMLGHDPGEVDGWMGRNTGRAIAGFQEVQGLQKTGAMSDELVEQLYAAAGLGQPPAGHIYVRQNFRPLFDAPVEISDADTPLGTHLFVVMETGEAMTDRRWSTMTLNDARRLQPVAEGPVPAASRSSAEVLARIDIPDAVRWRLTRLLSPGSSLAITDEGISRETTAKGTDFVVLTRPDFAL